jgi:hypothetical protein
MLEQVIFARRQSPDWYALAADYQNGGVIDEDRFVPKYPIPGFPKDIADIIRLWNENFAIDFFTCRAKIAALSRKNIASIPNSVFFEFTETSKILDACSRKKSVLFFHDDDDFFADDIFDRLKQDDGWHADTCVFPLFRVENDLSTFVRDGEDCDFIWGRRQPFHFRFQSNNYGINGRICSPELLREMKDHVFASKFAEKTGLSEYVYAFPVSATVKSPCSASMLGGLREDVEGFRREMKAFSAKYVIADLPDAYAWLRNPLREIAMLFAAVASGAPCL